MSGAANFYDVGQFAISKRNYSAPKGLKNASNAGNRAGTMGIRTDDPEEY